MPNFRDQPFDPCAFYPEPPEEALWEPGEYDARDTLLTNGMLDRYETHIVAIEHDPLMRDARLKHFRQKNPNREYIARGDFIESVHYIFAHGSDADTSRFELDEIAEHNRNLCAAIEEEQMQTLSEAFPEEYQKVPA